MTVPPMTRTGADFCSCRQIRYALWRVWDDTLPVLIVCGLNPSDADETANDRAITVVIGYARRWGYGGVVMVNLFAYCATKPADMRRASDPRGERNDRALREWARGRTVLCAWEGDGDHMARDRQVIALLREVSASLVCLTVTKHGHPGHPLFKRADLTPIPFLPTAATESATVAPAGGTL